MEWLNDILSGGLGGIVTWVLGLGGAGLAVKFIHDKIKRWAVPKQFLYDLGHKLSQPARKAVQKLENGHVKASTLSYLSQLPNYFDNGWDDGLRGLRKKKIR